jgi:hypothetical protein
MKTIIVNVPDKETALFKALINRLGFKSKMISDQEKEEAIIHKWIEEGMNSEEVSEEVVFKTLQKHGVKI